MNGKSGCNTMQRYIIMGVSGCGKSTIGDAFAKQAGLTFIDGDTLHPPANLAKMSRGEPLDDTDRIPWLISVGKRLEADTIIACSALKRSYRDLIRQHAGAPVTFLYLRGRYETLAGRMLNRQGHFMPPALLNSQIETLEEPTDDENFVVADIEDTPEVILQRLMAGINAG